ncbi:MAG: helix-turn-helix transcriptional regulator [Roseburia sp.]|nr:helix-turn-helix transcriptional regulator [Roseburia sp.]
MDFSIVVREIRQECYLSQQAFADELGVSFSTVNRWEKSKAIPNYQTMKRLVAYCKRLNVDSRNLEEVWREIKNGADTH